MSQNQKDIWVKVGVFFAGIACLGILGSAIIFCANMLQMPSRMDKFEASQSAAAVRQNRMEVDLHIIANHDGVALPGDGSDLSEGYNAYPAKPENVVAVKPTTQNQ
jgi:hypothetical protein